jgi:competence protein ComEC
LRADVLIAPHHGSGSSSSPAFLAAVAPRAVVIPVGHRNRYGHPAPEVLARYRQAGLSVWRTDRHGALDVAFAADGPRIRSARRDMRRYWRDAGYDPAIRAAPEWPAWSTPRR